MKSLDPRVNRLELPESEGLSPRAALDQLPTFEVFLQLKEGKPFQHAGIVHASDEEMAFVLAKEQYSRRLTCTGLFVVNTQNVRVSAYTEGEQCAYDTEPTRDVTSEAKESYQVFHLLKRGKQHVHAGEVEAIGYGDAFAVAKGSLRPEKPVFNVWIAKSTDIFASGEEDKVIWSTLPEKKFRDAIAYKAADKIKAFKEQQDNQSIA